MENKPSEMANRPPVREISFIDNQGNPRDYIVGCAGVTAIKETNECGEFAFIPWVEVWAGETLLARFCQNKLENIFY